MKKMYLLLGLLVAVVLIPEQTHAIGVGELAKGIAAKSGSSESVATKQVQDVFEAIAAELKKGESVTIRNFGRFYLQDRKARTARNPKTGEEVKVPARRYPKFSSSDSLKKGVN